MKIYLAPMEGLLDSVLRKIITEIGGFDYCVTEFLRVTQYVNPDHMFYRHCPELYNSSKTSGGTTVFFQILGGNPELMAQNALRAIELGSPGIDLNFGCPAKKVNNHDGGSVLLKTPRRLYDIISCVRKHVPAEYPVSAKIRLGYECKSLAIENAKAVEEANASWLTVHARTKAEGYRPPAHWEWIGKIREAVKLNVIANGDIWSVEDYWRCREVTGCDDVMLGRGAIARPDLALQIKGQTIPYSWDDILPRVIKMYSLCQQKAENTTYPMNRLKQWIKYLKMTYSPAIELFEKIKRKQQYQEIVDILQQQLNTEKIRA